MQTLRTHAAALVLAAALLGGCTEHEGPVRTETRELSGFDAIELEGAARVRISVGAPHAVELSGPAGLLERVNTDVRGSTLVISSRARDWLRNRGAERLTLEISLPELKALQLGGGNEVRIQGYAGGETSIKAGGAVDIRARGTLDRLVVHMSGAGNADLSKLITKDADVTVEGVGSVVVHATETLDATMNGVGTIRYEGNPRDVSTRMNGVGSITKIEPNEADSDDEDVELDPEELQPEYEDEQRAGDTEVI